MTNTIWTAGFWKGAGERAFHTFWESFAAVLAISIGTDALPTEGLMDISWVDALSVALVATILSIAKSLSNPVFTAGELKVKADPTVD